MHYGYLLAACAVAGAGVLLALDYAGPASASQPAVQTQATLATPAALTMQTSANAPADQLSEQDDVEDMQAKLTAMLLADEKAALQHLVPLNLDQHHNEIAQVLVAHFAKQPSAEALRRLEPLRANPALFASAGIALLRQHLNVTQPHQATALLLQRDNVQVFDVAAYQVGDQLARQNPHSAMAHLQTLAASPIRSQLVEGAMDEWLMRDPQAAAQYMLAHPADADLDAPILNMLRRHKDNSPMANMMQWAQRIHNTALRQQASQELIEYYQRFAPAQYKAWQRG
jgi:hypothetical protein